MQQTLSTRACPKTASSLQQTPVSTLNLSSSKTLRNSNTARLMLLLTGNTMVTQTLHHPLHLLLNCVQHISSFWSRCCQQAQINFHLNLCSKLLHQKLSRLEQLLKAVLRVCKMAN